MESFFEIPMTRLLHIDAIFYMVLYFTAGAYGHFMIYFGVKIYEFHICKIFYSYFLVII